MSVTIQYGRIGRDDVRTYFMYSVFISLYVCVCAYLCICVSAYRTTYVRIHMCAVYFLLYLLALKTVSLFSSFVISIDVCVYESNANEMYTGYCPFDLGAHIIYPPHGNRDGDGGSSSSIQLRPVVSMYGWLMVLVLLLLLLLLWSFCFCGDSNQHNHESAMYLRRPYLPPFNVLFCCRCRCHCCFWWHCFCCYSVCNRITKNRIKLHQFSTNSCLL